MKNRSLEFLKNRFKDYYIDNDIELPDRFSRREFAFVWFEGKGMFRHISFNKKSEIDLFIREKIPKHVYYSSAYYEKPDAPNMDDKIWMGAELIFDLDSDHLPNAEKFSYEQQLDLVKQEFIKLVYDFLLEDFGFDKKYIDLYFSGGRGYHCHIRDPKVLGLDSGDRREIVDYIMGRDLIDSLVFHEKVTGITDYKGRKFPKGKTLNMPKPSEPGWRGRISKGIIDIINEIKQSENPEEKLIEFGVKKNDAEKLLKDLSSERIQRIEEGKLDQTKLIKKFFLNKALRKTAVTISAGETDEPVTCDIKRLIRVPGSLHGKTGFKVQNIDIRKLEDFEPLIETIVFSDELVYLTLNQSISMNIMDNQYDYKKGENKVPLFLAIFLIGRGIGFIN